MRFHVTTSVCSHLVRLTCVCSLVLRVSLQLKDVDLHAGS